MTELTVPNMANMTPAERREHILAKARERRERGEAPKRHDGGSVYAALDGNTGILTFGRNKSEIPAGSRFVVTIEPCLHGWRDWQTGKVVREMMVPILEAGRPTPPQGEPKCGDLPKPRERDGWTETVTLKMSGLDGDLAGIILTLDCSNQSSRGAADELLAEIIDMMGTPEGEEGLFNPVIELAVDSYENKTYRRRVYFPVFKITGWTDGERIIPANEVDGPDLLG